MVTKLVSGPCGGFAGSTELVVVAVPRGMDLRGVQSRVTAVLPIEQVLEVSPLTNVAKYVQLMAGLEPGHQLLLDSLRATFCRAVMPVLAREFGVSRVILVARSVDQAFAAAGRCDAYISVDSERLVADANATGVSTHVALASSASGRHRAMQRDVRHYTATTDVDVVNVLCGLFPLVAADSMTQSALHVLHDGFRSIESVAHEIACKFEVMGDYATLNAPLWVQGLASPDFELESLPSAVAYLELFKPEWRLAAWKAMGEFPTMAVLSAVLVDSIDTEALARLRVWRNKGVTVVHRARGVPMVAHIALITAKLPAGLVLGTLGESCEKIQYLSHECDDLDLCQDSVHAMSAADLVAVDGKGQRGYKRREMADANALSYGCVEVATGGYAWSQRKGASKLVDASKRNGMVAHRALAAMENQFSATPGGLSKWAKQQVGGMLSMSLSGYGTGGAAAYQMSGGGKDRHTSLTELSIVPTDTAAARLVTGPFLRFYAEGHDSGGLSIGATRFGGNISAGLAAQAMWHSVPGYCYLQLIDSDSITRIIDEFGTWPTFRQLLSLDMKDVHTEVLDYTFRLVAVHPRVAHAYVADHAYHAAVAGFPSLAHAFTEYSLRGLVQEMKPGANSLAAYLLRRKLASGAEVHQSYCGPRFRLDDVVGGDLPVNVIVGLTISVTCNVVTALCLLWLAVRKCFGSGGGSGVRGIGGGGMRGAGFGGYR